MSTTTGKLQINEQPNQYLRVDPNTLEVFADADYNGGSTWIRSTSGSPRTYQFTGNSLFLTAVDGGPGVIANGQPGNPNNEFAFYGGAGVPPGDGALEATGGKLLQRQNGNGQIAATFDPASGPVPGSAVFELVV